MSTNTQVFLNDFTALRTSLAGISGINLYHLPTSFCRFVRKYYDKGIPSRVSDRLGEVMIFEKSNSVQVFNSDNVVVVDNFSGNLMRCIFSLIGNVFMSTLKLPNSFPSMVIAFLTSRNFALMPSKFPFRLTKVLRRIKEFAIGRSDEVTDTHVNTNDCASWLKRFWLSLTRKASVVFTRLTPDGNGLNYTFDRTVELDFDFANVLDIQLSVIPDSGSVAVCELDGLPSVLALETGISRLVTGFHTPKESLECFIQTAKSTLNRTEVGFLIVFVGFSGLLVRSRLIAIGNGFLRLFISRLALIKRIVVYTAMRFKRFVNRFSLFSCRVYSVFECFEHWLYSFLCFDVFSDCFRRYIPCRAHVITACPERRQTAFEFREFFSELMTGVSFKTVHDLIGSYIWLKRHEKMNVIGSHHQIKNFTSKLFHLFRNKINKSIANISSQNRSTILRTPNEVIIDIVSAMSCLFYHSSLIIG